MRRLLTLTLLLLLLCSTALADKTITITFTGDVTLGGEDWNRDQPTSFDTYYDTYGPEYFLSNMKDFFAEDDLTIVNLEGVLTDNMQLRPVDKGRGTDPGDGYWFRGRTEFTRVLTSSSVEVASIANNHIEDFGDPGIQDTVNALESAGIEWFGTRDRNTNPTEKFFFYEKDGVTIAFMSLYWVDYAIGDVNGNGNWMSEQIKAIRESGQADAIVCILHGGQEYGRHRTRPQTMFTSMAYRAGADLVITHHPHVVMGMDVFDDMTAFYSLGNFCFGGNHQAFQIKSNKKTTKQDAAPALIVRAVLTFADDGTYKGQQMTLYPVQITGVDRVDNVQPNNFQPKFITGPAAAHVLHLMQIDMNYDLKNATNKALKELVIQKENELAAMDSSEGMSSLTLPFLPAE